MGILSVFRVLGTGTFTNRLSRLALPLFLALGVLTPVVASTGQAGAASPPATTYTASETIPVPPASSYAGSGGGDGWGLAMTPTAVYNVFHHQGTLQVACHLQSNASPCWSPETITDASGNGFATSGQPGLWMDQATGHLFVYATRASDLTGGVVCIDTTVAATNTDPFCGFTPLTAIGDAPLSSRGISVISDPAVVGTHWYAFNYVNGSGVTGSRNELLCFDLTTFSACSSQPFSVGLGTGTITAHSFPPPAVAAIGSQVIVPVTVGSTDELACFNGSTMATCTGAWPVPLGFSYDSNYGAPFPLLSPTGSITGLCLPTGSDPCFDLAGTPTTTPAGMASAIPASSGWNGPGFVLGPRIYVPNGNSDSVSCYDASTSAECTNFPKSFSNLGLLYTVNADPQRPTCIWVNSDNGASQIQNFDAYTGGACGQGPIRVLASSFVVPSQLCVPYSYTSLQVQSPSPSSYTSGSVAFENGDATPISGIPNQPLDATGTANLAGLNLSTNVGLPEFLITLLGAQGTPSQVVVQLTWTGANDPSCTPTGGGTTSAACQRQYVFVHGIHGNFKQYISAVADTGVSGPNFASLLHSLHQLCPSENNVHVFDYYHDIGDAVSGSFICQAGSAPADTNVGPLYLDHGSLSNDACNGNAALALDATHLDQYMSNLESAYPEAPVTLLANSMGGAIARGWLRLAQADSPTDTTLSAVDSVVFLEGAQQGSIWAGIAELPGGRPLYDLVTYDLATYAPVLGTDLANLNLNPNDPGIKDLAPQSAWYNSVNSVAPPSSVAYFNFAADIHITLNINYFFGQFQLTSLGLGDYVMLPGNSSPTAEPALGGEDFLPGGRNIPNIHQFILSDAHKATYNIVIGPASAALAFGLIALGSTFGGRAGAFVGALLAIATVLPLAATTDPTDHFNLPSNTGNHKVFVTSCNGAGIETPTAAILGIVADPQDACP